MKELDIQEVINDLEIISEAITNGDSLDALKMLLDLKEDLQIILLTQ